jgi:hypothetical protein
LIQQWSNLYSIKGQYVVRTATEEDRLPSGIGWSLEQLKKSWSNLYSRKGQDTVCTATEEGRLPSGIGWSFEQYLMINSLKKVRCRSPLQSRDFKFGRL